MSYTTDRGIKLDAMRTDVEAWVAQYPSYWTDGPMKYLIYNAVLLDLINGGSPVPPE